MDVGVPTAGALSNEHPGRRTAVLVPICYTWLHTSYPLVTPVHGLGWARSSLLVHVAEAGSTVAPWRNQGRYASGAHRSPALGKRTQQAYVASRSAVQCQSQCHSRSQHGRSRSPAVFSPGHVAAQNRGTAPTSEQQQVFPSQAQTLCRVTRLQRTQ